MRPPLSERLNERGDMTSTSFIDAFELLEALPPRGEIISPPRPLVGSSTCGKESVNSAHDMSAWMLVLGVLWLPPLPPPDDDDDRDAIPLELSTLFLRFALALLMRAMLPVRAKLPTRAKLLARETLPVLLVRARLPARETLPVLLARETLPVLLMRAKLPARETLPVLLLRAKLPTRAKLPALLDSAKGEGGTPPATPPKGRTTDAPSSSWVPSLEAAPEAA